MKILLFSGLLFISTLVTEKSDCDSIQLDLGITHTSEGKNNGKIEVTVEKGRAPFTVYLFAESWQLYIGCPGQWWKMHVQKKC